MSPGWIGIIVSCFDENAVTKIGKLQVTAFQSIMVDGAWVRYDINLHVTDTPSVYRLKHNAALAASVAPLPAHDCADHHFSTPMAEALARMRHLQRILFDEERAAYLSTIQKPHCHPLARLHNSAVYTKSLCRLLEYSCAPLVQAATDALARTRHRLAAAKAENARLKASMSADVVVDALATSVDVDADFEEFDVAPPPPAAPTRAPASVLLRGASQSSFDAVSLTSTPRAGGGLGREDSAGEATFAAATMPISVRPPVAPRPATAAAAATVAGMRPMAPPAPPAEGGGGTGGPAGRSRRLRAPTDDGMSPPRAVALVAPMHKRTGSGGSVHTNAPGHTPTPASDAAAAAAAASTVSARVMAASWSDIQAFIHSGGVLMRKTKKWGGLGGSKSQSDHYALRQATSGAWLLCRGSGASEKYDEVVGMKPVNPSAFTFAFETPRSNDIVMTAANADEYHKWMEWAKPTLFLS